MQCSLRVYLLQISSFCSVLEAMNKTESANNWYAVNDEVEQKYDLSVMKKRFNTMPMPNAKPAESNNRNASNFASRSSARATYCQFYGK